MAFSPENTLWFVASSLMREDALEVSHHWEHEAYAGMVVMQELILELYPEPTIPTQRKPEREACHDNY